MTTLNTKRPAFLIISLLFFCFLSSSVYSAEITLNWEKPAIRRLAGYHVYCMESGTNYLDTPCMTIDSPEQTSCTISGLEAGQAYYLAVTGFSEQPPERKG